MTLLLAIVYILLLLVPGLISEWYYNWLSRVRQRTIVATALIFDLIIFIIMMIGLRLFNNILTLDDLYQHFLCSSFIIKYGLLSILIATVFGILFGILARIFWIRNDRTEK